VPLRNVADPPALAVLLGWDAEEDQLSGRPVGKTQDRLDESRLARPVGADDRDELAGADGEVHIAQNGRVVVAERRCAELDQRGGQRQGNPA
jgi:hypothetical protein